MEIKITKEMREFSVQTYIAIDGTEFAIEWQCKEYENKLLEQNIAEIETNNEAKNDTPLNGCEFTEYNTYRWFRPKNEKQIKILNDFFELSWNSLTTDDIGKWICIESGDEDNWSYRLDESIEHIKNFLSKFGYKVTIEEETWL